MSFENHFFTSSCWAPLYHYLQHDAKIRHISNCARPGRTRTILGVSWLGSSFFEGNRSFIVGGISEVIHQYPSTFAIGLFLLSTMLFSAAATVSILIPIGVALGIPAGMLIAFYPAANGVFFLPTYGTLLAAVSFDQTETTRIGKYLLNHSFMVPGLVTTISSVSIALILNSILPLN